MLPSIDGRFGNLTQICHGMLLGNTLEVVCFFFKLGECSLLTCISLWCLSRGEGLFLSPSCSDHQGHPLTNFLLYPLRLQFPSTLMYPTLPPKSSPAASGPWCDTCVKFRGRGLCRSLPRSPLPACPPRGLLHSRRAGCQVQFMLVLPRPPCALLSPALGFSLD